MLSFVDGNSTFTHLNLNYAVAYKSGTQKARDTEMKWFTDNTKKMIAECMKESEGIHGAFMKQYTYDALHMLCHTQCVTHVGEGKGLRSIPFPCYCHHS